MPTDAPVFRPATDEDRPIIRRLHRLTEVWDGDRDVDDDLGPKFAADDVKYVDRWSAERDGAIIAEIGGDVAGGAWLRHFTADDPARDTSPTSPRRSPSPWSQISPAAASARN